MRDTNVPGQPGWWFVRLSRSLASRQSRISPLEAYLDGDAPLPEAGKDLKEAYRDFQKRSRTNFAELVVEATAERMSPAGFRIGDDPALVKRASAIWSQHELDVVATDVHADMLGVGGGYVIVGPDAITREDPSLIIHECDPLRPNRIVAALKMYRDDLSSKDVAFLYLPGLVLRAEKMESNSSDDADGYAWTNATRLPQPDMMPVVHFRNRRGKGEFETHTDLLDRINDMVLRRLIITAMQAFRQRAIKGDMPETQDKLDPDTGLPIPDDNGGYVQEALDYADMFKPGAGALWVLPQGVELWESQTTDIQQILSAVKDDIRDLAAVTRTPMSMLLPDGQNQTAEGAQFAREGLVFKCKDRIKRAGYGWNQVMALALRFSGDAEQITDIETLWEAPDRLTLAERADAAVKLSTVLPFGALMTEIMQFSKEQAEEFEAQRVNDLLNTVLGAPTGGV